MKIDILSSDPNHPVVNYLKRWMDEQAQAHDCTLCFDPKDLHGGNILFLISCGTIIPKAVRDQYQISFVIHASDLPKGRGWSPQIWDILDGAEVLTASLIEVADQVDRGPIWAKVKMNIPRHFLYDEINHCWFMAELDLMTQAIDLVKINHVPEIQDERDATYYPKRTPSDSEVDPAQSLIEVFGILRTADPQRYPAFFDLEGCRYSIEIKKMHLHDTSNGSNPE